MENLLKIAKSFLLLIVCIIDTLVWYIGNIRICTIAVIKTDVVDHSKFYERVISRIINLHENGILKYLERKYFTQADRCGADVRADSSPLYISDVWAAFVVLCVGLTISTVCLVVEIVRARMGRRVLPGRTQT